MKESFSYFVILEIREDTTEEEADKELTIIKDKEFYGGINGLYENLDIARDVMHKYIEELSKEFDEECDEYHGISYFINGLDGYIYQYDKTETTIDRIHNKYNNDWVFRRYYIKEVKF